MFSSLAFANDAATTTAATAGSGISSLLPLILIAVVFYIFMIRPTQKRYKEHKNMVDSLKRGDEVVTGGGIIGKVTKLSDNNNIIEVEIAEGVVVKVNRSTVTELLTQRNVETQVVNDNNAGAKKKDKKDKKRV